MIREIYDQLSGEREAYLSRAEDHARLTVPSLVKDEMDQDLYKPFQSIGAYGTNAITNKLAGALYPAAEPFFKFTINATSDEYAELDDRNLAAMDASLSELEQSVLSEFTKRGDRSAITLAIKHLIVAGNAVLHIGEKSTRVYGLNRFVCLRDGSGTLLKLITLDVLSYETFKENHPEAGEVHAAHRGNRNYDPKTIEVYTEMCRKDGMWYVKQEAAGKVISKTIQKHPLDKPPYIALRFERCDGESYGRSYVENLYGDLRSLEELSKAMVEGSAINARIVFLVNPNGLTSMRLFEEAPNGGVIPGVQNDIATAQVNKGADLGVTASQIANLEERLKQAFMLAAAAQRDAERVTATEIQSIANEVEAILGGAYGTLSEEFQRPYVNRLLAVLKKSKKLPDFPEGVVDISIVTGTAGIGRGVDRDRLVGFLGALSQSLGPEALKENIDVRAAVGQLAAAFGIRTAGLIKSADQLAQEQEAAQQAQMAQSLGPQAIASAGQVTQEQMKIDSQQQPQENPDATQAIP